MIWTLALAKRRIIAGWIAATLACAVSGAASGAALGASPPTTPQAEARREQTARELEAIRGQIDLGEKRRGELSAEIDRLENDRAAINRDLIDTAARARDLGSRIDRAGEKLEALRGQQAEVRESLKGRRAVLAEVIGALQRMGRNPPPALLVSPQDALSSIRSATLLGVVVPEIRAEADVLTTELNELLRIGKDIDFQRASLSQDLLNLAEEEERLNLLLAEKKGMTAAARQELAEQSARAADLAARETNLAKLIERLESQLKSARDATEAARKAEADRKRREAAAVANAHEELARPDFSDPARIAPAMDFAAAQGLLPQPVDGVVVRPFGEADKLGGPAAGTSLATRVGARVTSPCDGWVVYAGPFRSYGQLLILNAGSGYHVVLAGMERIDVRLGQFVLAGEPVAVMGSRRSASAQAIGVESARPVLYVEFRKDGKSIDPSPWWADTTLKRVADDT